MDTDLQLLPTISVVIPTYNRASCICDAVESVLSQTYLVHEIIVVDDGSIDDTRQQLKKYSDKINYIYQENQGVSSARNTGIRQATGEWIAFLDSDDEWLPRKLARQVSCLKQYPEAIGLACDAEIVFTGGFYRLFQLRDNYLATTTHSCHFLNRPLLDVLGAKFFTPTWVFKKRAILASGLFNENISLYEDLDFSARFSLQGPWCIVPDALVRVFRKTSENLSVQHRTEPTRSARNLISIYDHLLKMENLDLSERMQLKKLISGQHFSLGVELFKTNFHSEAIKQFKQSIRRRPSLRSIVKITLLIIFRPHLYSIITNISSKRKNSFRRSEFNTFVKDKHNETRIRP